MPWRQRIPKYQSVVFTIDQLSKFLSQIRVFLIMAKYCARAVWKDDRTRLIDELREKGLMSPGVLVEYFTCWWQVLYVIEVSRVNNIILSRKYEKLYKSLVLVETMMDMQAYVRMTLAWVRGFWWKGFEGAHRAAAGLA